MQLQDFANFSFVESVDVKFMYIYFMCSQHEYSFLIINIIFLLNVILYSVMKYMYAQPVVLFLLNGFCLFWATV